MKKGLTLLELIVVIAIIAILMTVLFGSFSGSIESARAARCLTNLKNLASAVQMSAQSRGEMWFPQAGCTETFSCDSNGRETYTETKGWISWYSKGVYGNKPSSPQASASWSVSMYDKDYERRTYALTNGAIWKATGCNHNLYLCPSHSKAKSTYNPNYSYVMNAYFKWSPNPGVDIDVTGTDTGIRLTDRADRRLLFAEIQFLDDQKAGLKSTVATSGYSCDAILQYKDCTDSGSYSECIGFNHKSGKTYCANIVFMDGHVDKIVYPKGGLTQANRQDLTQWLCEAEDVGFDGTKYIKLED